MISSLVVLLLFLGFWLRGAYQETNELMHERGNLLYQEAVRQVEDSTFKSFVEEFVVKAKSQGGRYADTLVNARVDVRINHLETHTATETNREPADDNRFPESGLRPGTTEQEEGDTVIYFEQLSNRTMTLRSSKDTALQQLVAEYFERALAKTDLPQRYRLKPVEVEPDTSDLDFFPSNFGAIRSEEVVFLHPAPFLWQKISGQVLFSVFLFLLTTLAFWSFYRSNQRALQYTQLKNDFISNMTHELKTPITTVGLAVEAIKGFVAANDREKMTEYLNISQHELGRLGLLVDKVLKLSMFEQDVLTVQKDRIDLRAIVQQVTDAMKIQVEQRQGHFALHLEGDDFHLMGDAVHLTNVLFNILDNSLKYTEGAPEIKLSLVAEEQAVRLVVQDNGIGIPANYQNKVFDRFFRVPAGDRHNVKGYGLGLSYVADIVEQHGGQIQLHSEEGQGTSFQITLAKKG